MIAFCAFAVFGYTVASTIEWWLHRYCMHAVDNDKVWGEGFKAINRQHIIHHNATNTDMSVKPTVNKYKAHKLPMKNQRFQVYNDWNYSHLIS